jgi:hypothetical protein
VDFRYISGLNIKSELDPVAHAEHMPQVLWFYILS